MKIKPITNKNTRNKIYTGNWAPVGEAWGEGKTVRWGGREGERRPTMEKASWGRNTKELLRVGPPPSAQKASEGKGAWSKSQSSV